MKIFPIADGRTKLLGGEKDLRTSTLQQGIQKKKTSRMVVRNWEIPVARAMPCKILKTKKNCGNGASNKIKSKLACILEASEFTELRMGEPLPNHREDHVAGKGDN